MKKDEKKSGFKERERSLVKTTLQGTSLLPKKINFWGVGSCSHFLGHGTRRLWSEDQSRFSLKSNSLAFLRGSFEFQSILYHQARSHIGHKLQAHYGYQQLYCSVLNTFTN
ncbi:hypothetical protein TNIN_157241 [Trichonephila inaurata madagascariensis]|uniref:Uncharacterized protein n=1 Tax=Trichonephila inaurata madagascariensis TaxID=2747483 RepID=A0A8X7CDK3_9ARAC|nr:hypothetical protein TNIN_453511 [Trichonephila inaurata madagascariensis]GFY67744.1 hypothetical protein TNIN_157241 [Trichonephila inaurata madagascariensis]